MLTDVYSAGPRGFPAENIAGPGGGKSATAPDFENVRDAATRVSAHHKTVLAWTAVLLCLLPMGAVAQVTLTGTGET